jgi:HK97 family phage major capsid protein
MLKGLLEKRAAVFQKMKELRTKVDADTGKLSETDQAEFNKLSTEFDTLSVSIEEETKLEERSKTMADAERRANDGHGGIIKDKGDKPANVKREYRLTEAVRDIMDRKPLTGLYAEMHQEADREARSVGVSSSGDIRIPSFLTNGNVEQRDMTAGVPAAGGNTIETNLGQLVQILTPRLITQELGANYLSGLTGNLDLPRNNADNTAQWATEQGTAASTDLGFDKISLTPKRLAAFSKYSKQLFYQNAVGVENLVRERLSASVSRAVDIAAINGTGTANQPRGILQTGGISDVAIGANGGAASYANIVGLETKIATDNADMGKLAYLIHPSIAGKLKTTTKDANTAAIYLWTALNQGKGEINGYRALTSTLVPTALTKGTSTDCSPIIFGNWSELTIAQWGGLDITLDMITGAGEATVKLIVNSWWDVALMHLQSFAAIKDARP